MLPTMSKAIYIGCRATFTQAIRSSQPYSLFTIPRIRSYSSDRDLLDVESLLSKPAWSVRSLVPDASVTSTQEISPKQLHHLLRLSALPQPTSPKEEAKMLETLHSQLHFVRDIQQVDTEGVEPLQSIRDESEAGIREATIGLEDLQEALGKEDIVGKNLKPRRRRGEKVNAEDVENWDVLGTASEKIDTPAGKFFVVRSGKK